MSDRDLKFVYLVKNMNLLSSSIYKHLKTYLIKHKQSLILGECGSQFISLMKIQSCLRLLFIDCFGEGNHSVTRENQRPAASH
jgi:hypothetical protein